MNCIKSKKRGVPSSDFYDALWLKVFDCAIIELGIYGFEVSIINTINLPMNFPDGWLENLYKPVERITE